MTDATPLASEQIIAAIKARKSIYEQKRDKSDPVADDDSNRHGRMRHTVEAFDYLLHEVAALSATPAPSDQDASQAQGEVERLEARAVQIITEERGVEWAVPKIVRAMLRFRAEASPASAPTPTIPAGMVAEAYMRRCAFDRNDGVKGNRPRGWTFLPVTKEQLFDDDVPLFAATPTPQSPVGQEVERLARIIADLRGIKGNFERIAAKHPNDQPAYSDGVRPWGTGDLRHVIETLDAALTSLNPTTGAGETEGGK